MSLFYDPVKRKTRLWVYVVLILIPIIFVILTQNIGSKLPELEEKTADEGYVDPFN